jgi:aspartyl-tRNA(Asn)/glutamyl-tRNA(Gln) amidotransferase subunit B
MSAWETVIGLEIHVQLKTKSKLFSSAPNRFGDEPNTNISVVCTGQPGALPVLNKEAVHLAVLFGCAVQAHVAPFCQFDRKSYFYPDSPRNFQITQFYHPILTGGTVIAEVEGIPKTFAINRAHIEDDSGMLKHFSNFAGVDYNRAGAALLEIVSEPCIRSPKEAVAYAMAIKAIMEYIGASDCNMEEGSLRMDANISVRPQGEQKLRNKIEIKNMNSFHNMELALESEIKRQTAFYALHPDQEIEKGTYRFDLETGQTELMRQKEEAADYRYFPEPDLVPVLLEKSYIDSVKATLPELPYNRYKRYLEKLNLPSDAALILVNNKALSDYFEEGLAVCNNPRSLANWILVEFIGRLKNTGKTLTETAIRSDQIGKLVQMIDQGKITGKIAKSVADDMLQSPQLDCEEIVRLNPNYQPMSDSHAIEALVDQVLKENPSSIEDYKKGNQRAFGHLVGQVMKLSSGTASPKLVNEILTKKLR